MQERDDNHTCRVIILCFKIAHAQYYKYLRMQLLFLVWNRQESIFPTFFNCRKTLKTVN